jgi:hypothetical protein
LGEGVVTLVSYGIIAVFVVAIAVGVVVVRRRRGSMKPKKEERII